MEEYAGVHKFSKNLRATSKFWAKERRHQTGPTLTTQKHYAPLITMYLSRLPGVRDLYTAVYIYKHKEGAIVKV
jgi:hypothetical protein